MISIYLSGAVLSRSVFSDAITLPVVHTYNKVTLYGGGKVNYFKIINTELTKNQLSTMTLNTIPTWDNNTIMLCNFNNTIDGGLVTNLTHKISKFNVQRIANDETIFTDLGTVPIAEGTNTYFEDLTAVRGKTYTYNVIPETDTETGNIMQSAEVTPDWYNYSLTDSNTKEVYLFDLNLQSDAFTDNTDRTVVKTFNKYALVQRGNQDYLSGGITCIVGSFDDTKTYIGSPNVLDALRSFCNNGNNKYLKDRFGKIYIVDTWCEKYQYSDEVYQQFPSITIGFQEVESINPTNKITNEIINVNISGESTWGYF